jgi:hypothetical protein
VQSLPKSLLNDEGIRDAVEKWDAGSSPRKSTRELLCKEVNAFRHYSELSLSVEQHLEALDLLLAVVEGAVVHAYTAYFEERDAARGNVTRAAVTLNYCLQSSLHGYKGINPWRCFPLLVMTL